MRPFGAPGCLPYQLDDARIPQGGPGEAPCNVDQLTWVNYGGRVGHRGRGQRVQLVMQLRRVAVQDGHEAVVNQSVNHFTVHSDSLLTLTHFTHFTSSRARERDRETTPVGPFGRCACGLRQATTRPIRNELIQ